MTDRDELAALIREALNDGGRIVDRGYVAEQDIRDAADAILAAGWRKTRDVGHNHWTPGVMPDGQCPACDRIAQEVTEQNGWL